MSTPPRTIKASVVQSCSQQFNLNATLDKLEELTKLAKDRDGSQLCVFPEAFIGGYPKFSSFGTTVGARDPAGREEFARYHAGAITLPPSNSDLSSLDTSKYPALSRIASISQATGVFLIIGVIEKASLEESKGNGGTLYCTVVFVDPEKGYVGKHRKLMPTGTERLIWGQGDGTTLPVVEGKFKFNAPRKAAEPSRTEAGGNEETLRMSATICWENYMPLLRTYYYTQGTQLYCAPTVDARPEWQSTMQHIALEGRCFVLAACQYAQAKDFPASHGLPMSNSEETVIDGGSVIINPLGKILAGPVRGEQAILTAELDLDDIVKGKYDLDVVGHYARDDVFKLLADIPAKNL